MLPDFTRPLSWLPNQNPSYFTKVISLSLSLCELGFRAIQSDWNLQFHFSIIIFQILLVSSYNFKSCAVARTAVQGSPKRARTLSTQSSMKDAFAKYADYLNNLVSYSFFLLALEYIYTSQPNAIVITSLLFISDELAMGRMPIWDCCWKLIWELNIYCCCYRCGLL